MSPPNNELAGRVAIVTGAAGSLGRVIALELLRAGAMNVQVNAVCPGPVEGPVMDKVIVRRARALGADARIVRQQFMRATALGRMVAPEGVSRLVLFLCSGAARNITGQAIEVSAGYGRWRGS